jgi:hypothetical protein
MLVHKAVCSQARETEQDECNHQYHDQDNIEHKNLSNVFTAYLWLVASHAGSLALLLYIRIPNTRRLLDIQ